MQRYQAVHTAVGIIPQETVRNFSDTAKPNPKFGIGGALCLGLSSANGTGLTQLAVASSREVIGTCDAPITRRELRIGDLSLDRNAPAATSAALLSEGA